jgi:hypothetical protein
MPFDNYISKYWCVLDYAAELMDALVFSYTTDRRGLVHAIDDIKDTLPGTLADGMQRGDKEQAVLNYQSRFNN